jgi:hypothetical protein
VENRFQSLPFKFQLAALHLGSNMTPLSPFMHGGSVHLDSPAVPQKGFCFQPLHVSSAKPVSAKCAFHVQLAPLQRGVLGLPMGFMLVFRWNNAYERWWSGGVLHIESS